MESISDRHTVYTWTFHLSHDDIVQELSKMAKQLKLKADFRINLIRQGSEKNNNSGFGFIYFPDTRFYYAVLGKNFNGTERIEYYPDPDWVEPDEPQVITSWADASLGPPMLRKILPPLVECPFLQFSAAHYEPKPNENLSQLRIYHEAWVTKSQLESIFGYYASQKIYIRTVNGKDENTKVSTISFPRGSTEAVFAVLMQKKTKIQKPWTDESVVFTCSLVRFRS